MLEPHVKSYDYFCNEALTAMGNDNGGIPRYNVEIFENKRDAVKPEIGSKGKFTSVGWGFRLIGSERVSRRRDWRASPVFNDEAPWITMALHGVESFIIPIHIVI